MSEPVRFEYNEADLKRLLSKCTPEMLQQPMKDFFSRAGISVLNQGKLEAPVDTGRMRSSLAQGAPGGLWDLDASKVPVWLKVGTNVNAEGFSYPFALDTSPRYHYRGTRPELKGQPTKGWFSGALQRSIPDIRKWLGMLGRELKAKWEAR